MLSHRCGFTLIELLLTITFALLAIVAVLTTHIVQVTLREHARNVTFGLQDATRVMEELRQENSGGGCDEPSVAVPGGFASWDVWLDDADEGGGKSIQPVTQELIVVSSDGTDPLEVTVAACWRHRERVIGECTWDADAEALTAADQDGDGIITSPTALTTLITCRSI
jgi:type II secretory pathway pseudopilin PulG